MRALSNVGFICRIGLFWLVFIQAVQAQEAVHIAIRTGSQPTAQESLAARELARYLGKMYPQHRFSVQQSTTGIRQVIQMRLDPILPVEGYAITPRSASTLEVRAGSPRGLLYGTYGLLEKAGCGFYLSFETVPTRTDPNELFSIRLTDEPLVRDRMVLDWHNFLSSCSTWNLPDWQYYIRQAVKLRFNTLMIHTYGNNPIIQFSYNGVTKPIGYLTTSNSGRDWGTQHVNDVRRMNGGSVFTEKVFGSNVAQVPDAQKHPAARALMQQVFAYAKAWGMRVVLANDCDTEGANPQAVIQTLPASARFKLNDREVYVANPDTPEGYAYYRAQFQNIRDEYPDIDDYCVWFRNKLKRPWNYLRHITLDELPESWRREFLALKQKHPELNDDPEYAGLFAIGKIATAYRRIAQELAPDARISVGSWDFDYMPAMHRFLPPDVALVGLDHFVRFSAPRSQASIGAVSRERAVVPFVWAHHDDHTYLGRPYQPFPAIHNQLDSQQVHALGIIHWTTRPLDLYFKNTLNQIWQGTRNQPLAETCRQLAQQVFTGPAADRMSAYLLDWMQTAPMFGRETTDLLIDEPLKKPQEMIQNAARRQAFLREIDRKGVRAEAVRLLSYFEGLETFIHDFFVTQYAVEQSALQWKAGKRAEAQRLVKSLNPRKVIAQYARFSSILGLTPGEKGILISLNTRWLPYVVAQQQAVGLEPIRYLFRPTSHEPLAQFPGTHTYFFTKDGQVWPCLGQQETGGRIQLNPKAADERHTAGLTTAKPLTIPLYTYADARPSPGTYEVSLSFVPAGTNSQLSMPVPVQVRGDANGGVGEELGTQPSGAGAGRNGAVVRRFRVSTQTGHVQIELDAMPAGCLLSSVVVQPVDVTAAVAAKTEND